MSLSDRGEDTFDPIPGLQVGRTGRTCRLTGFVHIQDSTIRLYPTSDPGVWLEIDAGDVRELIESGDPALPATLIVPEQSAMSLRMDVTASTARALIASSETPARTWPEWRASPRSRLQGAATLRTSVRKSRVRPS